MKIEVSAYPGQEVVDVEVEDHGLCFTADEAEETARAILDAVKVARGSQDRFIVNVEVS